MFVLANLLSATATVLDLVLQLLFWLILIRALISWVNPDPYNPIVQILTQVTEPILSPIRHWIPPYRTGIDFSPFIATLVIYFLRSFAIQTLYDFAIRLR